MLSSFKPIGSKMIRERLFTMSMQTIRITTTATLAILMGLLAGCRATNRATSLSQDLNQARPGAAALLAQRRQVLKKDEAQAKGEANLRRLPKIQRLPAVAQVDFHAEPAVLPIASTRQPGAAVDWSLPQLEQMALTNNPSVARAAAQLDALHGKWTQVGLLPNPTMGYAGEEMGDNGTAGKQGGFVGQQFILGGKLRLNRAVVGQEVVHAEQLLAAQRQRVLTDVRVGYYEVLIAQRRLKLVRELVTVSNHAVEASKKLLVAKEIPRIGLLQSEVEAQKTEVQLRRARNNYVAAWRHLTSIIGQPNLAPQTLTGSLEPGTTDLQWEEQLQRILARSPEMTAASADLERARWAVDRACAESRPDVDVQVAVQHNNENGETLTAVEVGLPLPLWNRNQGGIHQAQSEVTAAARNIARVELDLRQRLTAAFQQYADAKYQADQFSKEIVPKAKETFDLVTEGYKQAEIGYLDMLNAQRTYFETRLSHIESLRELWQAKLQIEGMLLDNSLASR